MRKNSAECRKVQDFCFFNWFANYKVILKDVNWSILLPGNISLGLDSNPDRPVKDAVSLKISMTFAVAEDGGLGGGPPPVRLASFP